jgi:hypothetical protein
MRLRCAPPFASVRPSQHGADIMPSDAIELELLLELSRAQREAVSVIHARRAAEQRGDIFYSNEHGVPAWQFLLLLALATAPAFMLALLPLYTPN